jgi:hypothetical protein
MNKLSYTLITSLATLGFATLELHAGIVSVPGATTGTSADAWSGAAPGLDGWYYGDIRNSGTVGITTTYDRTSAGAASTLPGSSGSLEFNLTSSSDKAGFNQYFGGSAPVDVFQLVDLEGMFYDWYRSSTSTNPATQSPSIFIWIDADGDSGTSDTYGLKYEAIYNGVSSPMPEDAWQTALITGSTNLWSWNAPSAPAGTYNSTLDGWKGLFPNAVVTGMGIDVGSGWNGNFSGAVDFVGLDFAGTANDLFYDFQVTAAIPEPSFVLGGLTSAVLGLLMLRRRR